MQSSPADPDPPGRFLGLKGWLLRQGAAIVEPAETAPDLCTECGAYWDCQHRRQIGEGHRADVEHAEYLAKAPAVVTPATSYPAFDLAYRPSS